MKKIVQYKFLAAFALVALLAACNKNVEYLAEPVKVNEDMAYLKVIHVAPNFTTLTTLTDKVSVFYTAKNGMYTKINGTTLAYDNMFPTTTTAYAAIISGLVPVRFSIGGVVLADSINFYKTSLTLRPGKKYSYFITDNVTSSAMFFEDDVPVLGQDQIGLRFVHTILNDTAGKTVDLYSVKNAANIYENVGATAATGFEKKPQYSNDTLIVRRAGTNFELARINGLTTIPGRSYSLVYRGNGKVTTSTAKPRGLVVYGH
jgi:hypothetical protein